MMGSLEANYKSVLSLEEGLELAMDVILAGGQKLCKGMGAKLILVRTYKLGKGSKISDGVVRY